MRYIFKQRVRGDPMIENRVSVLLGARREKMSDLVRGTGLSRNTVQRLYHGTAERIDFDTLDRLCRYFAVDVGQILVYSTGVAEQVERD